MSSPNKESSKELLDIPGDGSRAAVIESLLQKSPPKTESIPKPRIFKIAKSPLFDQLQTFLPDLKTANEGLLSKNKDELDELDIENTDNCDNVIEMNVVLGEMDDNKTTVLNDSSDDESMDDDNGAVAGPVSQDNINLPNNSVNKSLLIETVESDEDSIAASSDSAISR